MEFNQFAKEKKIQVLKTVKTFFFHFQNININFFPSKCMSRHNFNFHKLLFKNSYFHVSTKSMSKSSLKTNNSTIEAHLLRLTKLIKRMS